MTLSLLAFASFVAGLIVFAASSHALAKELGRMLMWCGFLVLLLEVAGWHALVLR